MRPMGCALPKMRFWHAQEIVHEICFELTKQISVSGRGNPNGFPLAAAYFRAHRKGMPRLHPFRKPRYRQIGVRGAKAWFCLRESFYESIHEICFELTKQISVSGRGNPNGFPLAARRRSPLFAGGTRYALHHARRGGSSSSQKVLRYFLGALCYFARRSLQAARDTRPATLGAAAPPLPKKFFDTFWEPYVRGTPLYDRGNSPSFRKPCGKSGEKSKSAILDFSRNRLGDFVLSSQNKIFR